MHFKKITGFSRSPHPFQIISYLYFLGLLLVYFLIIFPLSSTVAKVFGVILEVCCMGTVLVSGYLVTATDPSDSKLQLTMKARKQNPRAQPVDGEFFCTYDHSFVHESSKHCRVCDRCTEGFDHHCKWINNDVGKKNYKSFVVLIMSVLVHLLVFLFFGALVTANYVKDRQFEDQEILLYTNHRGNIIAALVIMWIFMILSVAFVILDANLVFFHLFLIKKGLTTYQYILIVEERKENKRELEIARRILGVKGLDGKSRFDFVLCLNKKKKKKRAVQKSVPTEEEELKNVNQGRQGLQQRSRANSERQRISAGNGTLTELENHEAIEITRGSSKAPSLDFGSVGSLKKLVQDSNEKNDEEGYRIEIKGENPQLNIISEFNVVNEDNEEDEDKYLSRVPCTALPTLETLARETNFDEEMLQFKPNNPIKSARQIPTNRSPVSERRRRLSSKDIQVKNKRDVCLEIIDRAESENPKQLHEDSVFHGNLQAEKEKSSAIAPSKFAQLRFSAVQENDKFDDNDDEEKIEFSVLKRHHSSKDAVAEGEMEVKKIRRRKVFRMNQEGIKVNEEEEAKSVEGKKNFEKILQSRRTRSEEGIKELEIENIA